MIKCNLVLALVVTAIVAAAIIIYTKREKFVEKRHGMNLYGITSNEAYFPAATKCECAKMCANSEGCGGFWFYKPGQRCYMWT